jgi:hypothetical protein
VTDPNARSAASSATAPAQIVDDLLAPLLGAAPRFCLCAMSMAVDVVAVVGLLRERLPKTVIVGTTSCVGVASSVGERDVAGRRTAAALFVDGDGFFVGAASGSDADASALGERVAKTAASRAGISGAQVRLAIVHATPGIEEAVLVGMSRVITDDAVVVGGSGADNDLSGKWFVFGPDGAFADGAAVLLCDWPWKMAVSYQGGYLATEKSGKITSADGRRVVSIDGRPAADVYEGWMGKKLPRGQSILSHTTLTPLGLVYGVGSGLDVHVLVHPERINDDGSISCFADVSPGERIMMMEPRSRHWCAVAGWWRATPCRRRPSSLQTSSAAC